MSRPDSPADRAYVATRLAQMDHHLDQAREAMTAELDLYRDDWSSRHAELQRAHRERMDAMAAEQAAWLARWLDGDPDEGRPQDVDQGQVEASPAGSSPAPAPGPGPGQLHPDAELERAQEIKDMDMATYAALRAELGVRSPASMDHLFRQETQ
jgi:hypothetical protein